jgi:serine/threonine protein kinase
MSGEFPERAGGLLSGFSVGSRVAGYRLEEQIGAGGMAVVFRAVDDRLGRRVALKILAPALASDEAFRQRFIRESRAAAALDDPHIIPVHEAGEADRVLFIAMRYVPGRDVRALLHREGPLPPGRVAAIISAVASALDAAHGAGLVHRDVKPANMLVDVRPGRPDHVYLSDFGLSKGALSSVGLTGTGQVLGTPGYISPEQIEGKPVDGRADQYALACAAFEMLVGEAPFQRDDPAAVIWAHMSVPPPPLTARRPDLSATTDRVFARALAKAPADRYARCADFAEALREALGLAPYHSGPCVVSRPDEATADHPLTQAAWPAEAGVGHATVTVTGARAGSPPGPAARNVGVRNAAADSGAPGAGEPTAKLAPPESIVRAVRIMYAGAALPVVFVLIALLVVWAGK